MVDQSLETARLRGERIRATDFAAYRALFSDPRVAATLTATGRPFPDDAIRERFDRKLESWARHGYGLWMFRERASGGFVGYCGLQSLAEWDPPVVEVLYAVVPECWGGGLASEMAAAVIQVGFAQLGLTEIVGFTLTTNIASQRVLEKQGLRYERDFVHAGLPHRLYRVVSGGTRVGGAC